MQLAKLSICFLIVLMMTWGGWSSVEAQVSSNSNNVSSRIKYSSRSNQAKLVAAEVDHTIRVDKNLERTWKSGFIVQEDDDRPSEDLGPDVEEIEEPRRPSLFDPIDDEDADVDEGDDEDDLEFDDEEDDDLDLELEEDRKPTRAPFGAWPRKGIRSIKLDIRDTSSNTPEDASHQLIASSQSQWTQFQPQQKVFAWVAPDIRYQPLYFEDVALERYGQTAGPYHQSLISSFQFFKDFVFLPHQMRHDAPGSCDHPLGFCRPGNTTPYSIQRHYFGRPGWPRRR